MLGHVLRTFVRMVLTFFAIVPLVFFAARLSGSPLDMVIGEGMSAEDRAIMIRYYELDRSVWDQYRAFMAAFLNGEFGLSFVERRPVADMVAERLWPSAQLLISATLVTLVVAIPLGIVAAVWRNSWVGTAVMALAFLGYAIPNFVLAVFLILVFAFWLNWLPVVGNGTPAHFILPTLTLAAAMIAAIMRFTRNAMLDVLGQDYMRTARAKGLPESAVILKHGLRNAGITILSVVGLQVAALAASGSVVVETIFAWPGIGDLLVNAAIGRDYPVLQFAVLTVALAVIVINAVIDIAYSWADPRLRHSGGR